jgi:diadenosine tetraphosphate (Ap4A) HIT family hydrolase
VLDLTEATLEEQKELFVILNDLKNTITKIFQPDWFNYAFLGNDTRHLHGHFIPRYKNSKEFMGIVFKDERWGHNYKTDYNFKIPPEVLDAIQAKIKELI